MHDIPTVSDRLNSWKEIAAYLEREERTVQRWEDQCGLPVHRTPGRRRGSVFAYKHELDAWLKQGENGNEAEEPKKTGEPPSTGLNEDSSSPKRESASRQALQFGRWKLALAAGCLLGMLLLSMALVRSRSAANVHPVSFKRLTDDGRNKANLRTDGTTLYFNETQGARTVLVAGSMSGNIHPIDIPFSNAVLHDLSKDGRTLLITSVEGIAREGPLWIIGTEGGTPRRVGDVLCTAARYSPDNRMIACAAGNTVVLMDADGAHSHTLSSFVSPVGHVAWTPDGTRLRVALEEKTPNTYTPWEVAVNQDGTTSQVRRLPPRHKLLL